ncbi:MAG TPA: hypothetical protein VM598_11175 [Bdellovibrionota bacterium]|nr:hypothetical protein [Bdellovibrionota bacterium]
MRSRKVAFKVAMLLGAVLMVAASGCGSGKEKSAAGASGALMKIAQDGSGSRLALTLQKAKEKATGQLLLKRFDAEARAIESASAFQVTCSDFSTMTDTSCTAGSVTVEDHDGSSAAATCSTTCSSSTSTLTCTLDGEVTQTCGSDIYTFKNGSITATVPPATCSASGSTVTVAMSLGLDFAMDVKGGDIADFTNIDCAFSASFSIAFDATTGSAASATAGMGTGSFSCTIGGEAIDEQSLAEAMSENAC